MTRMNYIFVDFENVQETDSERIAGKPVKVVLMLGEQQESLPPWPVVLSRHKCQHPAPTPPPDGARFRRAD